MTECREIVPTGMDLRLYDDQGAPALTMVIEADEFDSATYILNYDMLSRMIDVLLDCRESMREKACDGYIIND